MDYNETPTYKGNVMPIFALVPAALAGAIIMDKLHARRNKQIFIDAAETITNLADALETTEAQARYFAHVLATGDVELTEFEAIAINALIEE